MNIHILIINCNNRDHIAIYYFKSGCSTYMCISLGLRASGTCQRVVDSMALGADLRLEKRRLRHSTCQLQPIPR